MATCATCSKSLHGNRLIGSDLANPDFMKLADSFGIGGYRVSGPEALRRALETGARRRTSRR